MCMFEFLQCCMFISQTFSSFEVVAMDAPMCKIKFHDNQNSKTHTTLEDITFNSENTFTSCMSTLNQFLEWTMFLNHCISPYVTLLLVCLVISRSPFLVAFYLNFMAFQVIMLTIKTPCKVFLLPQGWRQTSKQTMQCVITITNLFICLPLC